MSFNKVNQTTGELTRIAGNGDIPIDSTPTQGSTNAVQSGGTFGAIKAVSDNVETLTNQSNSMVNVLGAKNLLETKLQAILYDKVSVTRNSDGTFSVSTNGEVESTQQIIPIHIEFIPPVTGQYKLTGAYNENVMLIVFNVTDSKWLAADKGNGVVLSLDQNKKYNFNIVIRANTTLSTPVSVSPMLRPNMIADDTYVPYAMTNKKLTEIMPSFFNYHLSNPITAMTPSGATAALRELGQFMVDKDLTYALVRATANTGSFVETLWNFVRLKGSTGNDIILGTSYNGTMTTRREIRCVVQGTSDAIIVVSTLTPVS